MRHKIRARVKEIDLNKTWRGMMESLRSCASEAQVRASSSMATSLAFFQVPDLLKWTESLTRSAATVYDRAMDAQFTKTGIGGAEHRLFDGGHTIPGSWDAVRKALPDDSTAQEVVGWAKAYFKDWTTTMGMPFFDLEKPDFDKWVEAIAGKVVGVDRRYLYDLMSFDALEIFAAGLSVVGVFFGLTREDKEKVAEILGAMGISSIIAANPVMGLTTIIVTGYAYWRHGPVDMTSAVKGGGVTAVSAVLFTLMGLPLMVELAIVVTLTTLLKKHIVDNKQFAGWLKTKVEDSLLIPGKLLDLRRLAPMLPERRIKRPKLEPGRA